MEMKPGEKYLSVVVEIGGVQFKFAAFPNSEATEQNKQPKFKGKNVSVWVNKKKETESPGI